MGLQLYTVVEMTWHVFHSYGFSSAEVHDAYVWRANVAPGLLLSSTEQLRD